MIGLRSLLAFWIGGAAAKLWPTPDARTFVVEREAREVAVPAEDRTFWVCEEDRTAW